MSILSEEYFHNEAAAYRRLEAIVWPNGPVCPHCGNADPDRVYEIRGKSARAGLRCCAECRKQFRVTVGTVFESSHVPLHKWFQCAHLLTSSKKGISSHQMHRTLKVSYKTAWFMTHRLREAMRSGNLVPLGGSGKIVEADETFIGNRKGAKKTHGYRHKMKVLSLVERGGEVRSRVLKTLGQPEISQIIKRNVHRETRLMTDSAPYYRKGVGIERHELVNHDIEYVRGDVHTNTLEGYYSIFKRGMKGIYQHCSEKHLHRYVAEFDFRYNNRIAFGIDDSQRATTALSGIVGKRLTYRDSSAW